ncbi:sulfite exporter TauE/SafE family protein [Neobacillus drentensis]|uniref:sulfite exporter TauE/SafE family protein n=1 Tax=Neobacillus drentensis TaxID=220684 RepID=UPI002FFFF3AF
MLFIMLAGLLSGFGKTTGLNVLGIFTMTLLSLFLPAKEAVGILLPILLMGDLIAVTYYRRTVAWRHLFSLVPWILAGIIIGYFVLMKINNEQLKILLGIMIIGLNLFQVIRDLAGSRMVQALPSSVWFIGLIGILAGFTTMIGNVAGSVMAVYLLAQRLPKNVFVGTGAWFFLFVNVIKVPFYVHLGMVTSSSMLVDLMVIPGIAIGTFIGIKVLPLIPQQMFKWIILALGTLGAIKLIFSGALHFFLITGVVFLAAGIIALLFRNRNTFDVKEQQQSTDINK